jgi:hypothetical protein
MNYSNNWLIRWSEDMPVFGAEMLVADRRLKNRFNRFRVFLNTWRGALTVIGFTLLISYAVSSIVASMGTDDEIGFYLIYLVGFLVIPVYASFNSLAVGIMTLTDALDRKIAADWTAAGISPLDIAKQLILSRSVRQLPPAIIYSLAFMSSFLIMINRESGMNKVGVWQILSILTAFVLFQYMFIAMACFFAVLVRTLVGRFLLVSGYYITHLVLPIVLLAVFTDIVVSSEHENVIGTVLFAAHPYGPLISSVLLGEGPVFDFDPLMTFFVSIAVQIGYTLVFLNLAAKSFIRKVLE